LSPQKLYLLLTAHKEELSTMVKAALLVLLFAIVGCVSAQNWHWSSCGTGTYAVSNINMTPNPPKPGQNVTLAITGTLGSAITGGTVVVKVYWDGFLMQTVNDPLCQITRCPVARGPWSTGYSAAIPSFAPGGSYQVNVNMNDQTGTLVTCVNLYFTLS